VIEAPAAVGKTAFLADLVGRRGWVHHFVELAPDALAAGRSLAARVVRAYELGLQVPGAMPFEAASRPAHLERLERGAAGG